MSLYIICNKLAAISLMYFAYNIYVSVQMFVLWMFKLKISSAQYVVK